MKDKRYYIKNIRKDITCGFFEDKEMNKNYSVMFTEWWNGEGLDFIIEREGQATQKIELSMGEMKNMVAAMIATGFVEMEDVQKIIDDIKE